ncbi:hypothetical protein E2986_11889 [Frieseomelitta varia]|uniref:Uncharacterized protein n=1 Tax=Frieseomelitta varia TaxID=561572 RepID=A0A833VVF9_9HYME|nr:hypothetical protein E2986_11889 [Frieseomelitta varia]
MTLNSKIIVHIKVDEDPTMSQSDEEHTKYTTKHSMPPGIFLILTGLVLGLIWAWLHFFHRAKSTRGGMVLSSGQMLGGLNPSTDFLVGSTSQYGPVLTELPNQLTMKLEQTSPHDTPAIPLSDQEEETRTLMQDSTIPTVVSIGPNTIANQKEFLCLILKCKQFYFCKLSAQIISMHSSTPSIIIGNLLNKH